VTRFSRLHLGRYEPPSPRATHRVRSADGTGIHYEEHGPADAPTVLLSHGWTCSTLFWAPVVRELAADHRVVLYDQRGHGRSAAPQRGGYSTDALADDLCAVAEHALPDGRRAVFAGHSMGGMTLMAAATRPAVRARTAAALLASTGSGRLVREAAVLPARVRTRAVRDAFHRFLLLSSLPLGPQSGLTRAALKYGVLSPAATVEQVVATARVVHACRPRVRAGWGAVLAALELDAGVAALAAPTAVLVGTGDRLTPPLHARELAARLPRCVGLTELPGLGHMTPTEAPERVAGILRDLVRDHLTGHRADPEAAKEGTPA
jgi:pimeloyl-ACP methyl ester carboxylesterase